jgi:hypothetical protein
VVAIKLQLPLLYAFRNGLIAVVIAILPCLLLLLDNSSGCFKLAFVIAGVKFIEAAFRKSLGFLPFDDVDPIVYLVANFY